MQWLVVLGSGAVAGLLFTRLARRFAPGLGLVDAPDGFRKTQARAVPVAGGAAVLVSTLVALLAAAWVKPEVAAALTGEARHAWAMLAAALTITALGVVDDVRNLRPRFKLLGQLTAIAILIGGGGLQIHILSLLGHVVELGPLAVPFTVFWMLACINALNLIDGMDGLLGTVGLIALLSLAVIATMVGHAFTAAVAFAMAGAVAGFLRYNLPPASVYMGDGGSMLIGLAIGALAIPASLKGPATVALGAPVALLVLPMMDTTAAVIRRKLTGRGLATADRGHLHHVLQRNGLTTRRALLFLAALGLIASGGALATTALQNDLFALIAGSGVVLTLLTTRMFGHVEWTLLKKRVFAAARGLWHGSSTAGAPWEMTMRLQGTIGWEAVWQDLIRCAETLPLHSLCLDVNAPILHENYHARWDRRGPTERKSALWRLDLPLVGGGQVLGRVTIAGTRDGTSLAETLLTLAKILEAAETHATSLTVLAGTPPRAEPPGSVEPPQRPFGSVGAGAARVPT